MSKKIDLAGTVKNFLGTKQSLIALGGHTPIITFHAKIRALWGTGRLQSFFQVGLFSIGGIIDKCAGAGNEARLICYCSVFEAHAPRDGIGNLCKSFFI